MPDGSAESTIVRCGCGARLKVKAGAAGKKLKCPKCGEIIHVPVETYAFKEEEPEPDLMQGMRELAVAQKTAPALAQPAAVRTKECPRCGAALDHSAVLCVSCGYNLQTGRTQKGAKASSVALRRLAAGAGTFALGCFLSGAVAICGAVLWFLLTLGTGYEIGWVAWGLGFVAGLAMYGGYRKKNVRAGLVASGMAVFGILAAKVMIFSFFFYALVTGETDRIELKRAYVVARMTDEILAGQGIYDSEERGAKWDSTFAEAERMVNKLSDQQVEQRWAQYQEDDEREFAHLDESGAKRARLASHRAERRAQSAGLHPYSEKRQELYKEEFSKARPLEEPALSAEIDKLDAWQSGDSWDDVDHVRDHLVYLLIAEQLRADYPDMVDEGIAYPEGDEWAALHAEVAAEVDAMSVQDRLSRAKEIEQHNEARHLRESLAFHFADLQADREGLRPFDGQREELAAEHRARLDVMSRDELLAEDAKRDAWDDGAMWEDEAYVRDRLIYAYVDGILHPLHDNPAGAALGSGDSEVSDDEWERVYNDAAAKADAVPVGERPESVRRLEAQRLEDFQRPFREKSQAESRAALADAFSSFFSSMFGAIDLLFFGLAVVTAFRVASGGTKGV